MIIPQKYPVSAGTGLFLCKNGELISESTVLSYLLLALLGSYCKRNSRSSRCNSSSYRSFNAHVRILAHGYADVLNDRVIVDRIVRIVIYRDLTQRNIIRQEFYLLRISVINIAVGVRFLRIIISRLYIVRRLIGIIRILSFAGFFRLLRRHRCDGLLGIFRRFRTLRLCRLIGSHRRFRTLRLCRLIGSHRRFRTLRLCRLIGSNRRFRTLRLCSFIGSFRSRNRIRKCRSGRPSRCVWLNRLVWSYRLVGIVRGYRLIRFGRSYGLVWIGRSYRLVWIGRSYRLVWIGRSYRLVWIGRSYGLVWIGRSYGLVWIDRSYGLIGIVRVRRIYRSIRN